MVGIGINVKYGYTYYILKSEGNTNDPSNLYDLLNRSLVESNGDNPLTLRSN